MKNSFVTVFAYCMAAIPVMLSTCAYAAEPPASEEQKTFYAIGLIVARQLAVFNPSSAELDHVKQGIDDALSGRKPAVELSSYNDRIQETARVRRRLQGQKMAGLNKEFIEKAAREQGAVTTDSGLVFIPLKAGEGVSPVPGDTVKVHYRGTLPDGREFDSSYKRGTPAVLRMDGVIRCWAEGLQKMKTGGRSRLVCPAPLAYGDAGAGDMILPGAALSFEVELLEVTDRKHDPHK